TRLSPKPFDPSAPVRAARLARGSPPARALHDLQAPPSVTAATSVERPVPSRRVQDSATEMAQLVLPHEANVHGSVLGGTVMHWIDLAAAVVANRHCRRPVVTAAIDEMSFLAPINVG